MLNTPTQTQDLYLRVLGTQNYDTEKRVPSEIAELIDRYKVLFFNSI